MTNDVHKQLLDLHKPNKRKYDGYVRAEEATDFVKRIRKVKTQSRHDRLAFYLHCHIGLTVSINHKEDTLTEWPKYTSIPVTKPAMLRVLTDCAWSSANREEKGKEPLYIKITRDDNCVFIR